LLPVLNSLPPMEEGINVTMGFPLKDAPVSFIFEHLLKLHSRQEEKLYYKDILAVSNHPLILKITSGSSKAIVDRLKKENLIYIDPDDLIQNIPEKLRPLYRICFGGWKGDPERALVHLQELLFMIKEKLDRVNDKITLEFLYQYHVLFNKLHNLMDSFGHISTIKTLYSIFKDLVQTQTVDFKGEPFNGLQIMGMLESRVLDFENVIVTAVNEGTLPAGKSSNSFIPFDLKCRYSLPTYKEKDAIYTYHFYHLLQRAEHIFLLYNNDMEGFKAGEKSRFLLQLEINTQPAHTLKKYNFTPEVPSVPRKLQTINKSPEIMEKIRERAARGFSPSALTTYIRNPIDFYQQYILGVREGEEVEETIAYNTLGTVVHDTLEKFYRQWIGSQLKIEQLKAAMGRVSSEVALQFQKTYARQPIESGKNLLIFEVAKRYVSNFLKMEIREIEKGNITEILQVENDLKAKVVIPELDFPVFINGKVDRVDRFNGTKRIIDYKTGKVEQKHVEISQWEMLTEDYDKYSKTFQILTYAFMLNRNNPFTEPVEAGIISFKNLKNGFLKFGRKGSEGAKGTDPEINQEVLESYKTQLEHLIKEICNENIAFTEKEIPKKSW
ncbi:MAG TPA: PD-(D/E)XK nuclease family protein, partial [Salinimicrobium sp.]|nr:PD-(D/E)XK nuclease family protein [Salinimicrobium sp.]